MFFCRILHYSSFLKFCVYMHLEHLTISHKNISLLLLIYKSLSLFTNNKKYVIVIKYCILLSYLFSYFNAQRFINFIQDLWIANDRLLLKNSEALHPSFAYFLLLLEHNKLCSENNWTGWKGKKNSPFFHSLFVTYCGSAVVKFYQFPLTPRSFYLLIIWRFLLFWCSKLTYLDCHSVLYIGSWIFHL